MGKQQSKPRTSARPFELQESKVEDWSWVWSIRDGTVIDWTKGLEDEEILHQLQYHQRLPVRITENLYLGDANCIQEVTRLKQMGITSVLNLAGPMALKRNTIRALENKKIVYKRIDARDRHCYPMLRNHWLEAQDFIQTSTDPDNTPAGTSECGKCLVHCIAGINRSVLIVAAYYMLSTRTPILETMHHIRRRRGNGALQNEGFQEQLVAFARQNDLLGDLPADTSVTDASSPLEVNQFGWHLRRDSN